MLVKTKSRYPVSLNEVKQHLRIDITNNEDDDYITGNIIKAATTNAEKFIDADIAYTSNVYTVYDYCGDYLKVDEGNIISVSDVSVNGTLHNSYTLQKFDDHFTLDWTYYFGGTDYTLTATFITGYDPDDCPVDIKQAILIKCGEYYDVDRSSYVYSNIKKTDIFERLLLPYKTIRW